MPDLVLPTSATSTELAGEDCLDDAAMMAALQSRSTETGVLSDAWPPGAIGGLIPPVRSVSDPFPTFDGIALDPENNRVILSDENRHSLLVYDRASGGASNDVTEPLQYVFGPSTRIGYIAGVEVDAKRKEFYAVNNDGGDRLVVFSYDAHGNATPKRWLTTPHQSWDVSLAPVRDEMAISIQQAHAISIFRREAAGHDAPVRTIRGLDTQLEDPHGIYFDETHNELITANHGTWAQIRPYTSYDPQKTEVGSYKPGVFHPPSITFHAADAKGNAAPVRTIKGNLTGLNWPMGIDADLTHDEIAVANYGENSVRIYRRGDGGNVQPLRVIRGAATQIAGPVSVAIDAKNDELWVANYGDHTAVVFSRTASGNAKPKRIIRNAPANTPTCGFTNASAAAYDSKRDLILVPNCVSVPRISVFPRMANGNVAPTRVIEGQATNLSRTMHGLAFDNVNDEIVVPVALGAALLVFRGDAKGETAPSRVIQGLTTRLVRPQTIAVDPVNNEILTGDTSMRAVMVFDRRANGDVAPKRVISGPKTGLIDIVGVAVDPVRNVIVASSRKGPDGPTGLFIFDRMADGDVAPKAFIGGPLSKLAHFRQVAIDPATGNIFLAQQNTAMKREEAYVLDQPRQGFNQDDEEEEDEGLGRLNRMGFIAVYAADDNGDIPPRAIIKGPGIRYSGAGGVTLNAKKNEVIAVGGNGFQTFIMPELFKALKRPGPTTTAN
jgi:6-phosphogluconolactonase (cycloisomerase 2 family)